MREQSRQEGFGRLRSDVVRPSGAGRGKSPQKLLEELRQIQSTDVILPTTDGRELQLRCVPKLKKALAILLERLGLTLPQGLHPPKGLSKMWW